MTHIDVMKQALEALVAAQTIMGFGKEWDKTEAAITALRLAIEQAEKYDQTALELCDKCGWKTLIPGDCCLNCARQAEKQEPVDDDAYDMIDRFLRNNLDDHYYAEYSAALDRVTAPPQQEKQEPVTKMHGARFDSALHAHFAAPPQPESLCVCELTCVCGAVWQGDELVFTPPQRQPLTEGEIELAYAVAGLSVKAFARAIERAHGIGGGE